MNRVDYQQANPAIFLPRGRALVVDQDRKDLQTYAGVLRRLGFEVKPFTQYQEASRCLEEEKVDFVFVNQGTTKFEARGLVQRALEQDRRTPVVVTAHSADIPCYLEAMQMGAADYVEKPLAPSQVEHLVSRYAQPRRSAIRATA